MKLEPNEIELIMPFLERAMANEAVDVASYRQGKICGANNIAMAHVEKLARFTSLFLKAAESLGYDLQEVK